jgi:hypothetical protein
MKEKTHILILLTCHECYNDLFNVFDSGDIKCSACECEIIAERDRDVLIH